MIHHPGIRRASGIVIAYLGIRASAVPFLLPKPRCRPIRRAAVRARARARECMVTGLRMMRPSWTSLRMVWRELALAISLVSLGSSQILRLPQPTTEAARRFCVRRLTLLSNHCQRCVLICGGDVAERACKEGFATPESLIGRQPQVGRVVQRRIDSRRATIKGRAGVLTFSMMLSAVSWVVLERRWQVKITVIVSGPAA
jgi:hypothetical protein